MALDFLNIRPAREKGNWKIKTSFKTYTEDGDPVKDILIKGGNFYAIFDGQKTMWSTKESRAAKLIDDEIRNEYSHFVNEHHIDMCDVGYLKDSDSQLIDKWHKYVKDQIKDNFIQLDCKIAFSNTVLTREDYCSKRLPYALPDSVCPDDYANWDRLVGTLYDPEERLKLEWAIGSIVSGDSTKIQKFVVLYGSAGSGKSTVLNVIADMFDGYTCVFDSQMLTDSKAQFSLEPFKNNPLVAIQHDGDLSKITENTRLNSVVSHERMNINEKNRSLYESRFLAMLFVGTNKPVRITDGRSGLTRRLIDVSPSGRKVPPREYNRIMKNIEFEHGAIARHCLDVYNANMDMFSDYLPVRMIESTNDTYNFILEHYRQFVDDDGISVQRAWSMYNEYVSEAKVPWPLPKRDFKEEMKSYFERFENNRYSGFLRERFENKPKKQEREAPKVWLSLDTLKSYVYPEFDTMCSDMPAQYATEDESRPMYKWENCKTTLKDIDTTKLHFVKPELNHIVVDFDMKDENGNKSLELNIQKALSFPPTYAETSKSGGGLHLHYIYDGDVTKLSSMYDKDVEIKVFNGNSSLRRKLTLCNDLKIAHISSGLPIKKEKKMIDQTEIQSEEHLRAIIKKCLRKEVHDATKPNVDMICKVLQDAKESGMTYDLTDMFDRCFEFAASSSNQASTCIKLIADAPFKSETEHVYADNYGDAPICFFDVEVFPNLFLVCYKVIGTDKVIGIFNPKPSDIERLFRYRLVGFNNRRYDNHMIYACYVGYSNRELYELSKQMIDVGKGQIGAAYNLSYTDIYDYMADKMSLKKLELKMGIRHDELAFPWDEDVPEDQWERVKEYCCHDVEATEAAWNYTQADFTGRRILAELAGMSVNDTTNALTTRFIFGDCKEPQREFHYRNLAEPVYKEDFDQESINFLKEVFPEMMAETHGDAKSLLPYFEGYEFKNGKSTYLGENVGEGGYAEGFPGYYINTALLDVMSMHPHSAMAEVVFGARFTRAFYQIVYGRVNIKHKAWEVLDGFLGGRLAPYIEACKNGEMSSSDLAFALKIAINSVYGLTSAHFQNAFKDERNVDNIVAKRGALFMIELKHTLLKMGYPVAHIKTDSIKIPNADPSIIEFVMKFGKKYGYTFEHEATYEKMVLVNDAVYIAKYATPEACEAMYGYVPGNNKDHADGHRWTATGTQFQIDYVFKKLFSKEEIKVDDYFKTFSVQKGDIYLDFDEDMDIAHREALEKEKKKLDTKIKKLEMHGEPCNDLKCDSQRLGEEIMGIHDLRFVGRVGEFVPVKAGTGGATMYRVADSKMAATAGSTGYRWIESTALRDENDVDVSYWASLADEAKDAVSQYHEYQYFVDEDIPPYSMDKCCEDCVNCPHFRKYPEGLVDCQLTAPDAEKEKASWCLEVTAKNMGLEVLPF